MNITPVCNNFIPVLEIGTDAQKYNDDVLKAEVLQEMTDKYFKGCATPPPENLADGTYQRDGGSFTIKSGRVISLTAANGEKFTDITYDTSGNILSMQTSAGHTWQQRDIVGPDGMLKRDGYNLKLSNLTLRYDQLVADSKGVTHLSTGHSGFVSTLTLSGTKGTMEFRHDGTMSRYSILTKAGNSCVHSPPPFACPERNYTGSYERPYA